MGAKAGLRRWLLALYCLIPPLSEARAAAPDYPYLVRAWQGHDARLLTMGMRLAQANVPFCARVQSAVGVMFTDFTNFAKPEAARAVLGMSGTVAVEAIAQGGPADRAGIRAGDELFAVNGVAVSSKESLDGLNQRLDAALATGGNVTLRIAHQGEAPRDIPVAGVPACESRFTLSTSRQVAQANGKSVTIALPLFAEFTDEDEAATMVAHELAHNVLDHKRRADAAGRNYATIRMFEREADRLALWLMANAGYDPAAAPRFMAKWGAKYDQGITRAPTHDGWRDRLAAMQEELSRITSSPSSRRLDWRPFFPMK